MLVPNMATCASPGTVSHGSMATAADRAETTANPGAERSGFRPPSRRGPRLEKKASCPIEEGAPAQLVLPSMLVQQGFVVWAPTAITESEVAGERIVPSVTAPWTQTTEGAPVPNACSAT